VSSLDDHRSVIPTMRGYTVIITQMCAVAKTLPSTKHTHDCCIVTIVLYYCLCCDACTVTYEWLEPILYRQSDAHGSPWNRHGHTCAAYHSIASDALGFKTTLGDTSMA